MNILIAPDKFKGSLTSFEVCKAIEAGIHATGKNSNMILFPMADGGDGFADVMQYYLQTKSIKCQTVNPLGREIEAQFQWDDNRKTAIIEIAAASGMVLLKNEERNPLKTSTHGTGILIKKAIKLGANKIILGLGGSATNDAGTGILETLGYCFEDSSGNRIKACGESLLLITKIIPPAAIPDIKFEIACDVQNVLYGLNGAAHVYAAQKGADDNEIKLLDTGLKNISDVFSCISGKILADIPGSGAAGGIAAGLMTFFDTNMTKGIEIVIEASKIKKKLEQADLIITGEGKIDTQSLQGKVVGEIAKLAFQSKIPAIAFCGILETTKENLNKLRLVNVLPLVNSQINVQEAMTNGNRLLTEKVRDYFLNKNKEE